MSLSKLLLSLLVFILAPVTLCFGSPKTLYDHTFANLAAYPVPNVWLEGDPMNSYVAAIVYTGDGQRPNNYFRDVSVAAKRPREEEGGMKNAVSRGRLCPAMRENHAWPRAIPKPPQCDINATSKPPQCVLLARR
jgi:hypothetical protein